MVEMIPGMEMLRFTNTGTEATMHALRVARGYTRREKFIKFEGQYNGVHDYVNMFYNLNDCLYCSNIYNIFSTKLCHQMLKVPISQVCVEC